MRYENNDTLREYLGRGAAGAYREHLRHPAFEFDASAFADALGLVRQQHPQLDDREAEARAAFRLLTSGTPPEVAVALPSRWYRTRAWAARHAPLAGRVLELAWAAALLILALAAVIMLSALTGRAADPPPAPVNVVHADDVARALLLQPPALLPQLILPQLGAGGSVAARVQFLNGANAWTNVSASNPLPVTGSFTCTSGCSGGGGGGGGTSSTDEAAFTEGATSFTPGGGYYKSSFTALTSGQQGTVALTANRAFHVTLYGSGGTEITTLPVSGTFWQTTQPVSGTFWQSTQPVSLATWAGGTLGAMANYGTSPGAVLVPGVNAYITNTPAVSQSGSWSVTANAGTNLNTSALALETGGNLATLAGGVSSSVYQENIKQVNGHTLTECGVNGCQSVGGNIADGSALSGTNDPIVIAGKGSGNARVPIVCDNWVVINQASSSTATIIAGVSAKNTYFCSINVVVAAAENINIVEGTGTNCGTTVRNSVFGGGTTAASGWNLAANGGVAYGTGIGVIATATGATADNICLMSSGTSQISGTVSYTQF